jgi:AcrR family transcriptional regulator
MSLPGKPKRSRGAATPHLILAAAQELLRRKGSAALTIDAVAAEANLSKGGVLHHFPSKDALITALATARVATLRARIAAELEKLDAPEENFLMAYIRAHMEHIRSYRETHGDFSHALLVAAAESPQALAEFRTFFAETFNKLGADEADRGHRRILTFATFGLTLASALGVSSLDFEETEAVFGLIATAAEKG